MKKHLIAPRFALTSPLLCFLVTTTISPLDAQNPPVADVFPLDIGNQWSYRYLKTDWSAYDDSEIVDTGSASVEIIDAICTTDSTRWQLVERRHLHTRALWFGMVRWEDWVDDSTSYEIIQLHSGNNRLYRSEPDAWIWSSIFPWSHELTDTTAIYRYEQVDSSEEHSFHTRQPGQYNTREYDFVFKAGVGQIRVTSALGAGLVGVRQTTSHTLLEATVSSVPVPGPNPMPGRFILAQNYPNPFNPSTTIRFALPQRSHVTLTVFNCLGQQVGTLVQGEEEAGYHEVKCDGSRLASGVYLYRIQSGSYTETKTFVIVR